jgi:hypothetical protein
MTPVPFSRSLVPLLLILGPTAELWAADSRLGPSVGVDGHHPFTAVPSADAWTARSRLVRARVALAAGRLQDREDIGPRLGHELVGKEITIADDDAEGRRGSRGHGCSAPQEAAAAGCRGRPSWYRRSPRPRASSWPGRRTIHA